MKYKFWFYAYFLFLTMAGFCFACGSSSKSRLVQQNDSLEKQKLNTPNQNNGDVIKEPNQPKIKMYCWCFINTPITKRSDGLIMQSLRNCTTTIPLSISDLINEKSLNDSLIASNSIARLTELLLRRGTLSTKDNFRDDPRFLLAFERSGKITDTVVYVDPQTFYRNGFFYKYSFNVMDSIRFYFNKKVIDCPGN